MVSRAEGKDKALGLESTFDKLEAVVKNVADPTVSPMLLDPSKSVQIARIAALTKVLSHPPREKNYVLRNSSINFFRRSFLSRILLSAGAILSDIVNSFRAISKQFIAS